MGLGAMMGLGSRRLLRVLYRLMGGLLEVVGGVGRVAVVEGVGVVVGVGDIGGVGRVCSRIEGC